MKAIDLTGNKYGRLTVISRTDKDPRYKGAMWLCKCDCGNTIAVRASSLKYDRTKSCGCLRKGGKKKGKRNAEPKRNKANICIDCKKACGGCSWSALDPATGKIRFEPVPGWTAEEVTCVMYQSGGGYVKTEKTFKITACPEFEEDVRENRHDCMQLTKEESDWFLDNIRRVLRRWATEEEVQCVRG